MMNILFMGRKAVSAAALDYLAGLQDVSVVGVLTDNHLDVSPTSDVAKKYGLPLFSFEEALAKTEDGSLCFDLGISILYWRKLRGALLTTPKLGVVNFHPAPLPQFKGTAGYNLAILNGLSEWGVTAHYMDATIDTGGIIEVATFPIDEHYATVSSLEIDSAKAIYELFLRTIRKIQNKQSMLPVIKNAGGVYVSRQEMEAMKRINPGDDVDRKIRAFWYPPYDGAYVEMNGKKYTLVDREILASLGDPGVSSLYTKPATAME